MNDPDDPTDSRKEFEAWLAVELHRENTAIYRDDEDAYWAIWQASRGVKWPPDDPEDSEA
jgi:hypothetical protein